MRVALVARRGDFATGLGRYSSYLADELPRQGVEVLKLSPRLPVPRPVAALALKLGRDLDVFFQNYACSAELPAADVYHMANEYQAALLALRRIEPSVVTFHAFFSFFLRARRSLGDYYSRFEVLLDRFVIRGLRRASVVIAVSHYLKRLLVEKLEIPAKKVHMIHEGVDTSVFKPQPLPTGLQQVFDLGTRRWILYVGSEQPRKNFLSLVRAFGEIKKTMPDVGLLKVGNPEVWSERDRVVRLAARLGVLEDIRFVGHVGADLPRFYNMASVFVFPSLYEGFGFPPLEAMACGTPVVCSNRTSLPEVTADAAISCNPDWRTLTREVSRVLRDRELAADLRQRGLARAGELSWAKAARETAQVYSLVR